MVIFVSNFAELSLRSAVWLKIITVWLQAWQCNRFILRSEQTNHLVFEYYTNWRSLVWRFSLIECSFEGSNDAAVSGYVQRKSEGILIAMACFKSVLRKMKGFEGCGFLCLTDQTLQGCFKSSHQLFLVSLLSTCSYSLWIMSSSSSITLYVRWKYPLVGHREVKRWTSVFAHKKSNHYLEFDRQEMLQPLWKWGFLKLKALFWSCRYKLGNLNASVPHLGSSLQPLLSYPRSLTVKPSMLTQCI